MRKGKLILPIEGWKGLVTKYPKTHPQVHQDALTEGSVNVKVSNRGALRKREGGAEFTASPLPVGGSPAKVSDGYEAVFTDGARYLLTQAGGQLDYTSGDGSLQKVMSGLSADGNLEFATYRDRVYFGNGSMDPKVLDRAPGYGGCTALPATVTITDYTELAGASVTVNGVTKTEGVDWTAATSNSATGGSLATALGAISGVTAVNAAGTVTIRANTAFHIAISDTPPAGMTLAALSGPRIKDMGCQAPTEQLTGTPQVSGGSVPDDTYYYAYTFLYYGSEESNGGGTSASITVAGGGGSGSVDLVVPVGGYGVSARKIYRSVDQIDFTLVGTIEDNTTTAFTDTAAAGGAAMPLDNGEPRQFRYVVQHKDRIWYGGISGATADVDFSEAGQANIFSSFGNIVCNPEDVITGLVVFNDRVIVFNRRSFGQILGTTADSFYYEAFPGSVGCVDNRSIRIRTLRGVPVLIWLSDKGFYAFNGSSVEYISEAIEDLVNFNIQQVRFLDGSNAQDTAAQFDAGTKSSGIDTSSAPGFLTTKGYQPDGTTNPAKDFDSASEWEGGTGTLRATRTADHPNALKAAVRNVFSYGDGTLDASLNVDGGNLKLDVAADNAGEADSFVAGAPFSSSYVYSGIATKFTISREATLSAMTLVLTWLDVDLASVNYSGTLFVAADVAGSVGSDLWSQAKSGQLGQTLGATLTGSPGLLLAPGSYWVGLRNTTRVGGSNNGSPAFRASFGVYGFAANSFRYQSGGTWTGITGSVASGGLGGSSIALSQTPVASTGEWVGPSLDTGLFPDADTMKVVVTGSYTPAGTGTSTCAIIVGQADSQDDLENEDGSYTSQTIAAFDGDDTVTFAATKQWVNLKVTLSQTDDRYTPTLGQLTTNFTDSTDTKQAVWESAAIDCSADVTAYSLDITKVEPAGTSVTVTAAVSDDNISYSAYAAIGSYAGGEKRYIKLKAVVTASSDGSVTARLTALAFSWALESTWESAAIDAGVVPTALSVFDADYEENGGTVSLFMREAASEGGLAAAVYYPVEAGEFPETTNSNHSPLRWFQIKAVIDSEKNKVPFIDSVTVRWQTQEGTSIRAASMFHDRAYYCAVAGAGESANSMMLVFDEYGNWTKYTGLVPVSIFSFYNVPYYGTSDGKIIRFFDGKTDAGAAIEMDVRTKAFDFTDITKKKVIRAVVVTGLNLGSTFTPYYSLDEGVTWLPMTDSDGDTSFTVGTNGAEFVKKLVPIWPNEINGKSIMVRLVEASAEEAEVHNISVEAFVREGEILNG